ncbi:leucine-rich repeat extensin-like protein 1, partial [Dendrobium catenatum]|uniref:leucine-rich repeat extensin-like protein 1 n=1 Tax=Dendrobium catenatum TaxID=906689 RepID=UPI0009F2FA6C
MALSDDHPRKSFTSKFQWKKFIVSRATQPDEGEGPSVPPADVPTPPPPPRGQQQSPSEQGQGHLDPSPVVPPYFPGHYPPLSTSPHFPSPDQTHASPFYPYYPPPSSQTAGPSTGPHPPYPYPYYYPYPVQHE